MKPVFVLQRVYTDMGTFGKLYLNGSLVCHTVEKQWVNNEKSISCIPEGEYTVSPHNSPKHRSCFILEAPSLGVTKFGASQRTHILIHPANHEDHLEGCIAPGKQLGVVDNKWAVVDSRTAMDELKALIDDSPATLLIEKA